MMLRLVVKEWKECRLLAFAALSVGLVLALAWRVFSSRPGIGDILAGTLFLVALPLMSMLFGARAYSSELQTGTWAFLASRPMPRWKVWAAKYLSSFGLVIAILGFFAALTSLAPQARNILATVPFDYGVYGGKSILALGVLLSILAFHIAFALSFLTPKLTSVLFVSLLILAGLALLLFGSYQSLQFFYPFLVGLNGVFLLISASFAAASLLVYLHADLSQPAKARGYFSKVAAGFVAGSLVLSAGLAWISGSFIGPRKFVWNLTEHGGKVYFTSSRGIMVYDPAEDDVRAVGKRSWRIMPFSLSLGGNEIALLNYCGWRGMTQELWVMKTDGSERRLLASARDKASPLRDFYLFGCSVSADGRKIALLSRPKGRAFSRPFPYVLWRLNADGTGADRLALGEPLDPRGTVHLVGWLKTGNAIVLFQFGDAPGRSVPKLVVFDLDSGTGRAVAADTPVALPSFISPLRDLIVRWARGTGAGAKTLSILDLNTFAETKVGQADELFIHRVSWAPDGKAFAFLARAGGALSDNVVAGVYSVERGEVIRSRELDEATPSSPVYPGIAWLGDGAAIAFAPAGESEPSVEILSPELTVARRFPLPRALSGTAIATLVGAGTKVVIDAGIEGLWRLDTATGGWKKIFRP